jgi:hypothetical protein
MTQSSIYHETPGQGHTGWPLRGSGLVLDEAYGLNPDSVRERAGAFLNALSLRDALRTPTEAARRLRCSIKTLKSHVKAGELKYVIIGRGIKRPRKMFTDADLDQFIANQSRKDAPACPSTKTRARQTGSLIFGGEVIDFTAPRKPPPGGKPKR